MNKAITFSHITFLSSEFIETVVVTFFVIVFVIFVDIVFDIFLGLVYVTFDTISIKYIASSHTIT